jgi:hypothetical protein
MTSRDLIPFWFHVENPPSDPESRDFAEATIEAEGRKMATVAPPVGTSLLTRPAQRGFQFLFLRPPAGVLGLRAFFHGGTIGFDVVGYAVMLRFGLVEGCLRLCNRLFAPLPLLRP